MFNVLGDSGVDTVGTFRQFSFFSTISAVIVISFIR